MVNVGGLDIVDGNKKLILSIVSQLQRMYTLQVLQGLASHQGVNEVSEDRIVAWANEKVTAAGKTRRIKHFKDSTVFLTPEDIVEVKSKMLLTFVSAIWAADLTRK